MSYEEMIETRKAFARTSGFLAGNTSAACLTVADALMHRANNDHKVLSIMYDHGLWYVR